MFDPQLWHDVCRYVQFDADGRPVTDADDLMLTWFGTVYFADGAPPSDARRDSVRDTVADAERMLRDVAA